MNLTEFAEQELKAAGLFDADSDYSGMLGKAVLDLIKMFSKQGHSGASAAMVSLLFNKLSQYKPIQPLRGTDNEWVEVGNDLFQNKRCSRVFKDTVKGVTYDIDGYVFVGKDGISYTSSISRKPIKFPYTPITENVREHSPRYYWIKLRSYLRK